MERSWRSASSTCYTKTNNFHNSYQFIPVSCLKHNSRNCSATSSLHFALLFPSKLVPQFPTRTHLHCVSVVSGAQQGYRAMPLGQRPGLETFPPSHLDIRKRVPSIHGSDFSQNSYGKQESQGELHKSVQEFGNQNSPTEFRLEQTINRSALCN